MQHHIASTSLPRGHFPLPSRRPHLVGAFWPPRIVGFNTVHPTRLLINWGLCSTAELLLEHVLKPTIFHVQDNKSNPYQHLYRSPCARPSHRNFRDIWSLSTRGHMYEYCHTCSSRLNHHCIRFRYVTE